jgi:FlaA1/EpsC-like NDP-sugar epimerase
MKNIFKDKNILVTGGTGSIGSEIVRKLLQYEPKAVRVFSNDEYAQFSFQQELQNYPNIRFLVGNVRDKERLRMAAEDIDFIFHTASLKHVPICEYNPFEAVKTNVLGTQNVIEVAMEVEAEKLISISTDKAVNPVNVMGATKLLAERLIASANCYKGWKRTVFSCVRFGNVFDSRGSVVTLFQEQIKKGGPITITAPDMTRFVISISKAVELVLKAMEMAQGGEIFIFKMPALRIGDLAEVMLSELAPRYGYDPAKIKTKITGKRAGEKFDEELLTKEEVDNAYEVEDMFVVMPEVPTGNVTGRKASVRDYSSRGTQLLTKGEIKALIQEALR